MAILAGSQPTDAQLITARTKWTNVDWAKHFTSIGVAPSPVRYDPTSNDVLRHALNTAHGRRCWWQGSSACQNRALLLSEAQIDHVVPSSATANQLRNALSRSTYQRQFFDVHDPGNLAIICGACNREKSTWTPPPTIQPWMLKSYADIEKRRNDVIKQWNKWHKIAAVDDATLRAVVGVGLADNDTREFYAYIVATMIERLANQAGQPPSFHWAEEIGVQTETYQFRVGPSESVLEWAYEVHLEMEADERRYEGRAGL